MATINRNAGGNFFDKSGSYERRIGQYTGPAAYVAGGDSFVPGEVALGSIAFLDFEVAINAAGTIYLIVYDTTNKKAIWYDLTGTQIVAGTDLSGFSARFEAVGK